MGAKRKRMLFSGRADEQTVSQSGWWRGQTNGGKEKKDVIQWESRTADSESEWVMEGTDKWGQRERGCYSVGEQNSRHSGWWG